MYASAKRYYKEYGDLLLLATYMAEEGCSLGQWVVTQRTNKRNNNPVLTQEQRLKLAYIGMIVLLDVRIENISRKAKASA